MTQLAANKAATARTSTMRAATILGPRELAIRDVVMPEPGHGQVRVRLEGCGVCASNIPPWEGRPWFTYPMAPGAPGHEGWGVIDRLGRGVTTLAVGDRVGFLSGHAYAEYDVAEASEVVRLPTALASRAFPAEPLACAMNIFRRSSIDAGQTVAILGCGFLGNLLAQLCADRGARVIAISRRGSALEAARTCGADHALAWTDRQQVIEQIAGLTGGVGGYGDVRGWCDCVIDCTGKQEALDLIGEITRVGGRAVIAGFHQDGPRNVDMQLWNWRGLDVICAHERDPARYVQGMTAAIEAAGAGRLRPGPLMTHAYPLAQLGEALDAARERPEGFIKAVIQMAGSAVAPSGGLVDSQDHRDGGGA